MKKIYKKNYTKSQIKIILFIIIRKLIYIINKDN